MLFLDRVPLMLVTAVAGSGVTFLCMSAWLQHFAFTISWRVSDFAYPFMFIATITFATITYFAWRAARLNPARVLRSE